MASTSAAALRAAKRQLRKSMAQTLEAMRPEEIARQSHKVAEQVLKSQTYARARSISVYIHMDVGEVMTDEICRSVLKDGKRLYVPLFASPSKPAIATGPTVASAPVDVKTEFATDMIMLRLRDVAEYESMAANRWGIREPPLTYADGTIREEGECLPPLLLFHNTEHQVELSLLTLPLASFFARQLSTRRRAERASTSFWLPESLSTRQVDDSGMAKATTTDT